MVTPVVRSTRRAAAIVLCLLTAAFGTATASAVATGPRADPSTDLIVKFDDGSAVRMVEGRLVARGQRLPDVDAVLDRDPGVRVEPLFSQPADELAADLDAIEQRSGQTLADLDTYVRVTVPTDDVAALAQALGRLDVVERVEAEPPAALLPATPNFAPYQGYRQQAPVGIGIDGATAVPGARGDRVRVVDVETEWNTTHEDLSKARNALVPGTTACSAPGDAGFAHGTAVAGILSGDDNGFGVTGIVPAAQLGLAGVWRHDDAGRCVVWRGPDAINDARRTMAPGDVLLLEQQAYGPRSSTYLPYEWYGVIYDVVRAAVADGIIVVEVAGNSALDLDDPAYGSPFPMGKPDSGAIIVGAGAATCNEAPERTRLHFSNYGSRVDLQAWGECIVTSGYGSLHGGSDLNAQYTAGFGGTSGASAIVAGTAASLSSAIEARTGRAATPAEVRSALVASGTPQRFADGHNGGHIGPMPDLAKALALRGQRPPVAAAGADLSVASGAPFVLDAGQSRDPAGQPLTFAWAQSLGIPSRIRDPNRARIEVEGVQGPATLTYEVRVTDTEGLAATDQVFVRVRAPK